MGGENLILGCHQLKETLLSHQIQEFRILKVTFAGFGQKNKFFFLLTRSFISLISSKS